jgi:glutathione synthase/RimK-type ligase-like ATP-grasp enzyme
MLPYKLGSNSARLLAQRFTELRGRKVFQVARDSRTYKNKRTPIIINWGCSVAPYWYKGVNKWINNPLATRVAGNKLLAFQALQQAGNVNIPEFTTEATIANNWGTIVFGRKTLTGHSGQGILVFDPQYPFGEGGLYPVPDRNNQNARDDICPLYVRYIKKQKEFRVHVIFGKVVDIQQKKKREGFKNANFQVRNHTNGWVYCRENITEPTGLRDNALNAVAALGLDFGAVDIIWNEKQNKCYVLEVNTAPGLEGSSVKMYADNIWEKLNAA